MWHKKDRMERPFMKGRGSAYLIKNGIEDILLGSIAQQKTALLSGFFVVNWLPVVHHKTATEGEWAV